MKKKSALAYSDYSIVFELNTMLTKIDDDSDYVQDIEGEIMQRSDAGPASSEEYEYKVVGRIGAYIFQVANACNNRINIWEEADAISQETMEAASVLFAETGGLRQEFEDWVEIQPDNILFVDRIELDESARGCDVGLLALRRTVEVLGAGVVIIKPFPLQFSCMGKTHSKEIERGRAKLVKHWARAGFKVCRWSKEFMLLDLAYKQPKIVTDWDQEAGL